MGDIWSQNPGDWFDDDKQSGQFWGLGGNNGDDGGPPAPPQYELPAWAQGLPEEQLKYIRQYLGTQLQEPSEYGMASNTLQGLLNYSPQLSYLQMPSEYDTVGQGFGNLLNYQPSQFQFPMEEIQRALDAQQAMQLQQYQNQIRPVLAKQGQLDSSYYTNLLDKYLQGQQTSRLGNTANLLTQQATQNYDLSKWLPQLKTSALSGLSALGGARTGINQYNATLNNNLQTYLPQLRSSTATTLANLGGLRSGIQEYNLGIPLKGQSAFGDVYGEGINLANNQYNVANNQWQQAMKQYENDQAQNAAKISSMGQLGGGALGALIAGALAIPTGGLSLAALPAILGAAGGGYSLGSSLGGTASTLFGGSGGGTDFASAYNAAYPQQYNFPQQQPIDLSSIFKNFGMNQSPQIDLSSIYNPNWNSYNMNTPYYQMRGALN